MFHRKAHAVSVREGLVWSVVWIALVLAFVGAKMLLVSVVKVPIALSLGVVAALLFPGPAGGESSLDG